MSPHYLACFLLNPLWSELESFYFLYGLYGYIDFMGLFILFIKNEVLGDRLTHLRHPVRCRIILWGQINLISGIQCYNWVLQFYFFNLFFFLPSRMSRNIVGCLRTRLLWTRISWQDNAMCVHPSTLFTWVVHVHPSTFVHLRGCTCVFASGCVHIHTRHARLVFD